MIRRRESPHAFVSGMLALLVHGLFFLLLVVSFSWKNTPPAQVAQVELWDSLPRVAPPEPEPKPEPKPEPPPPKPEPKPEPVLPPEPKAEIQLKPKPEVKKPPEKKPEPKPEPKKIEPKKPDPAIKAREEELKRKEALRKLQQDLLNDEQPVDTEADKSIADARAAAEARSAAAAASSGIVDEYKARIVAAIKRNVNRQLCGSGKPKLVFAISLMPTGEVSGTPRLVQSSGMPACDDAVMRAILKSQPLPLPPQAELFAQFRDLTLTFRPNDDQ